MAQARLAQDVKREAELAPPRLPCWLSAIDSSHRVALTGGFAHCLHCGSVTADMTSKRSLMRYPCRGSIPPAAQSMHKRLMQGFLPHHYRTRGWPDEARPASGRAPKFLVAIQPGGSWGFTTPPHVFPPQSCAGRAVLGSDASVPASPRNAGRGSSISSSSQQQQQQQASSTLS